MEYYADARNWYDANKRGGNDVRMVIGSLDTEGHNWLGGKHAREALAAIRETK